MRTFYFPVGSENVPVHMPETAQDLAEFREWAGQAARRGGIAIDTETTGLDIYSPDHRLRTVQMGTADQAWVIPYEFGGGFVEAVEWFFKRLRPHVLIHNASYDWLVLDRHVGVSVEELAPLTRDTSILAALVDPREEHKGGIGRALKPLSARFIDPSTPDTQAGLHETFRKMGYTRETGWAHIDVRTPIYVTYAGGDVILTARLYGILMGLHQKLEVRPALIPYEHELARICAVMQRTGMVLDIDYCHTLADRLTEQAEHYAGIAARYGVTSVNSSAQVATALQAMGERWPEKTDSGKPKVDKAVLTRFADIDRFTGERLGAREPNTLADAVYRSKRAAKWRSAYVDTFLETVDATGRVHPNIQTLQARTGRMSITRPALQTLPSKEHMIRRALLADEGHVMISCDFDAVEMRVLAALADVTLMKEAIAAGEDLHNSTARLVFGPDFTQLQRTICKGVSFGKVYGGGARTISRQTGVPESVVRKVIATYDRLYPQIHRFGMRHQRLARENGMVTVSLTGRRMPLDRERAYAVVNYQVQSAARDVFGQSLIYMAERGLLEYLRLPIHDEVVVSAPRAEAEEIAREIEDCMTMTLGGVPITAGASVGGRSWGSLYGADY